MRLGSLTTTGKLTSLRATKPAEAVLAYCTAEAKPVHQVYMDDDGKIYHKEDLGRARVVDGVLEPVPLESVVEAKASSLPLNTLNLTVHKVVDIQEHIFPSANSAYVFQPVIKHGKKIIDDPVNVQYHDAIKAILTENPDIALVGVCNLQNYEGLFRLSLYKSFIIVQKQLYPENLNQFDFETPGLESKPRQAAVKLSHKLVESFEPSQYKDTITSRLVSLEGGSVGTLPEVQKVDTEFDILAALEALLD